MVGHTGFLVFARAVDREERVATDGAITGDDNDTQQNENEIGELPPEE